MNQLKWSLFAAYVAGCIVLYPSLPARIPFHFNFAGEPNAWGAKLLAWFGLPLIALFSLLLLTAIVKWLPRMPQLWNVPEKKRFLAMTYEERQPIYRELAKLMDVTGIATIVLMGAVQFGMYAVATGRWQTLPSFVTFATVIFVAAILVAALVFNGKVKRLITMHAPPLS